MTGDSRGMIENSPHLEAARAKGYEVLYMTDPVDELVLQHLTEFEGKKLKSVGKGEIELGTEEEKQEAQKELKDKEEEFKPLLEFLQKKLEDHVKQVRLSSRLTTSPACLVADENEYSPMLERALKKSGAGTPPEHKRVMELNPKHPLIERMKQRQSASTDDSLLNNAAEVLLGLSLLAEGSELPDAARFNRAATEVLGQVM
jgi:molecular chaperone HtpG